MLIKVLLKYKREKASDIDIRRGQKECLLASFLSRSYRPISKLLIRERKHLETESCTRPLNVHFEIALAQGKSSPAIKQLT